MEPVKNGVIIMNDDMVNILHNLTGFTFKNKRVLVTGGASFLGSWISETILAQGGSVTCIDNFTSGRVSNIGAIVQSPRFIFIDHDISIPLEIEEPPDYILHLASRASPPRVR